MMTRAQRYRGQAVAWQKSASDTDDPDLRRLFEQIASDYEMLARCAVTVCETKALLVRSESILSATFNYMQSDMGLHRG